ncbi:MAG TPA: nucleoside hydrolase [Pseudomonadales bacterium]|nr:nucleoside hydrolase [Pseudomonadales bacterium]
MPHRIIFDTDPGIDDAMALLFAHRSPDIELLGITTTFGNASVVQTTRNALLLADAFGIDCPVHMGAAVPLAVAELAPPDFVHGTDGLGDAGLVMPHAPGDATAVAFIIDTVRAHPGEVTLVAVGRMTNLALVAEQAPDVVGLVKQVVIMGGVIGRHGIAGNVTPCAEANIFGDPHAADIVMQAGWPLTMVGLDVTMRTRMEPAMLATLVADGGADGALIGRIVRHYQAFYARTTGNEAFPVHDSSALACLVAPQLYELEAGGLRVVTEGIAVGQTLFSPAGRTWPYADWATRDDCRVCTNVDGAAVLDHYLATLLR